MVLPFYPPPPSTDPFRNWQKLPHRPTLYGATTPGASFHLKLLPLKISSVLFVFLGRWSAAGHLSFHCRHIVAKLFNLRCLCWRSTTLMTTSVAYSSIASLTMLFGILEAQNVKKGKLWNLLVSKTSSACLSFPSGMDGRWVLVIPLIQVLHARAAGSGVVGVGGTCHNTWGRHWSLVLD